MIHILNVIPSKYGHLVFDKSAKIIQWGNISLFKEYWQDNWIYTCERMSLDLHFTTFSSKCNTHIKVRADTINLPGFSNTGYSKDISL